MSQPSSIMSVVRHAFQTVPFYARQLEQQIIKPQYVTDFEYFPNLPVVTKEAVQRAGDDFLSCLYPKESLTEETTSGSTGIPLRIYKSQHDRAKMAQCLWRFRMRYYDIDFSSPYCMFHQFFRNFRKPELFTHVRKDNALYFNVYRLDKKHLLAYYREMMRFNPVWIMGTPSAMYIFASYIEKYGLKLPPSLRYIELAGEYLFPHYRKKVEEVFHCPVVNHYGCTETYGIALECPCKNLHILEDNVYAEVLGDDGVPQFDTEGKIVITALNNKAMPFIRYEIGDRGILHHGSACKCGCDSPTLELSVGRVTDFIIREDGESLHSGILYFAMERLNSRYSNAIRQFLVIQKNFDSFTVKLAADTSLYSKEQISSCFVDEMAALGFDPSSWQFEFVDQILPDKNNGKLSFFTRVFTP